MMEDVTENGLFGKKVFFLNPPAVLEEIIPLLSQSEFEVYTTRDHIRLARFICKEPQSLIFINIDEGEDETVWRGWIQKLHADPVTANVGIGVLTMMGNDDQRNAYLMDLGVNCGFIILKMGSAKTAEILIRTLEANEARGKRKYVRIKCPPDSAEFNCKIDGELHRGTVLDLSIAGMAVFFSGGHAPPVNSRIKDIQLSLKGLRIMVNGIVVGAKEMDGHGPLRLAMFEPASLDEDKRLKLRSFIGKVLQSSINEKIAMA
ncbi:MAG: hypothetical protein A2087_11030 [Spirochaetes bacterium GWD1_61_31]|nr:MAG: hypothetical protein A2Y37_10020 [Spirochaetes bacterium GWB1_60_80]OHD29082.1 MAG: hypothetical protein A2004_14630 [Spirochaetes bacterium GWC1_61_12]OHD43113.1 MAG: hypothetical protein A2087_11030 [Spirochaetes bacterium GWD1_61_31]OHD44247.1 MAG: hypothetical protein A2Y35_06825 [Spirochaetes bacterium GWE1_60_18]OHD60393.1 MAG: hypothetical protein A2Y32_00700 [Spirochaetes bacterium GWF1_60_12]HAP43291.1 hypothetical protein [Spirochaetaceae bacterium]